MTNKHAQYHAAIDVGTNSFHLVIVKVLPEGGFVLVGKEKVVVRLGEAPKQMKHLTEEAIERGVDAMKLFAHIAGRKRAEIRAVATSAVREAENGTDFIDRVREKTGIEVEVVSGFEEARLIYLGILQALPVVERKIALFDIGGGSTEILVGKDGTPLYANSYKIGAIRMTQRFLPDEKISKAQVERLQLHVRGELYFAARQVQSKEPEMLIASSGTAQTIGSMALMAARREIPDQLNGVEITLGEIKPVVNAILSASTHKERSSLPGCDPRRADILAAGGIVLQTILEELQFDSFTISSYALREGIILDTINKERGSRSSHPRELRDQRFESVLKLGHTYNFDEPHGRHTARLALQLYDQLENLHDIPSEYRELLEAAALLHDIGYYISPAAHHKHSLYLIQNSALLGFNREEIDVIANIARYHRKSHPKLRHASFVGLTKEDQRYVPILAGILRIGDSLDRTHRQSVSDIRVTDDGKQLNIEALKEGDEEIGFEVWSATRRKGLLGRALGREVILHEVPQSID